MPDVIGVQGGLGRVKVFCQAVNRADVGAHPDQEAFVRMEILVISPKQAGETEVSPNQQDVNQQQVKKP